MVESKLQASDGTGLKDKEATSSVAGGEGD